MRRNDVAFGEWLRRRRRGLDLTQQELANQAGCAVSTLRKIEAGERRPSKELAAQFAICLDIGSEEYDHFITFARTEPYPDRPAPPAPAAHLPGASSISVVTPAPPPFPAQNPSSETPPPVFITGERALEHLDQSLALPLHFPSKTYHRLIGRSHELKQLLEALREPERKPVIVIVGLGGMGKTALAQEAMDHCWREGLFEQIVWASAKTERFVGEGTRPTGVSDYGFEPLLADIARQCDRLDLAQLPPDQRRPAVKQLLLTRRVLVVLDNLETIPDGEALVDEVCQILGQSKLLLTGRHHIRHERAFSLDLGGLYQPEGLAFLREDSAERGINMIAQAGVEDLLAIHQVTGGAPLAMKLVIGQVSRWPLAQVLNNLRAAHFAGPNYDFYRFIFKQSWDMLAAEAQQVLVSMAVFDLTNGSSEAALRQVSRVAPEAVQPALDQLILLSLVDVLGDLAARRYTLHPLTHYFILSDIVKKWS